MARLNLFSTLIIVFACFSIIYSKNVPNCECSNLINYSGQGNCQNPKSNLTKPAILCYVKTPSKCPDLKYSSAFPGKLYSKIACDLYKLKINGSIDKKLSYYSIYIVCLPLIYKILSCVAMQNPRA